MQAVSSYAVEIRHMQKHLKTTAKVYREAVAFLIVAFDAEWDTLSAIGDSQERFNAAEDMAHKTKQTTPKYNFDGGFPCMPCYMRRAAIQKALGAVKSYRSNLANWEEAGRKGNPPRLKNAIQDYATHSAHRAGIRISRVCPWGTSKLAFDGSGEVERGIDGNYSICRFHDGKIYNCDLSAAYNIGARYFLRGLLKPLPETARSQLEAKVPSVARRTTCTLSTLLEVLPLLGTLAA